MAGLTLAGRAVRFSPVSSIPIPARSRPRSPWPAAGSRRRRPGRRQGAQIGRRLTGAKTVMFEFKRLVARR
jgi:hypothetical protein